MFKDTPQWQYMMVERKEGAVYAEALRDMLNRHGKDGWQLCAVGGTIYYFKREL